MNIDKLKDAIARYSEAYDIREKGIGDFYNDEGKLKEGVSRARFDEACIENWADSHADLGVLLSELADLIGTGYKEGDRVKVSADATTANGGTVFFDGEIEGVITVPADREGDVEVRSDAGIYQYVSTRFLTRIYD